MKNQIENKYATPSLVAITLTAVITSVHHIYKLGFGALILGLIIIPLPYVLLRWYKHTRNKAAYWAYGLLNAWIIIGFGLVDGLWDHTLKIFLGKFFLRSFAQYFSQSPIGSFPFEATGILASIAGMFAAYYGYKFLRAAHAGMQQTKTAHHSAKWIVGSVIAGAVLIGGYLISENKNAAVIPEGGAVKIGVIVTTTGPGALLGNSFLKAVQMAKEDLKKTRYQYELVVEDSGTSPAHAERAIRKLIKVDKVKALVGGISATGKIVKPYATAARIPHLCVCSVKTIGDGVYNFTNIPLPEDEAMRWVKEAQKRGIKKVALLTQIYPSIDGHVKALKEEAAKKGVRIVYETRFEASTTDFRPMITEAGASAPDVYFVEAFPPALNILGRQLKDAGVQNIASVVALSLSDNLALFEGAWYTDSNLVDIGFRTRFEQKYPGTRFATHMMPYAYDSFNILVQGFESGRRVAEYVQGVTEYNGPAGKITREPGSGNFRSTPAVWVIENGKPELHY